MNTRQTDPPPGTPEFEDMFNRMIGTWSKSYRVILKTRKAKQKRLNELLTWDKCNGNKWEHTAKITALEGLLNDSPHKKLQPI